MPTLTATLLLSGGCAVTDAVTEAAGGSTAASDRGQEHPVSSESERAGGGTTSRDGERSGHHVDGSRDDDVVRTAAEYDAALDPLRDRSDVLEERFAGVQGDGYNGPERVRRTLRQILPEYAALLDETRAIEVSDRPLRKVHRLLLRSLRTQQKGLELALRALRRDDDALMTRAGSLLQKAQRQLDRHRRLLRRVRE